MAALTFNSSPYYDDYDENKNYLKILFRPGYAVQARELTQLQTALQHQVTQLGDFNFEDGSPVIGGSMFLDKGISYIKIESSFTPASGGNTLITDNYYTEFLGTKIIGQTTGVSAIVLDVVAAENNDPITLYVRYLNSGDDGVTKTFSAEEEFISNAGVSRRGKVLQSEYTPTGLAVRYTIEESIFYINGHFVHSPEQSTIVSKYDIYPDARIVFQISENIVTSSDDNSLNDNAIGSPNQSAPGANRYQISLDLKTQPIDFASRDIAEMLQLMVIENGDVREKLNTRLGRLGDILAQRTFEESGNYTLKPFLLNLREHYNDGTNNGLYTTSQLKAKYGISTDNAAIAYGKERVAVGLEKSVAYVQGYRVEIEDIKYIDLEKARDSEKFYNASIATNYGNYIYINNLVGLPDLINFTRIELQDIAGNPVGLARIRSIEYITGTIGTTNAVYRAYLFDVEISSNYTFEDVIQIATDPIQSTTETFSADIDQSYGLTRYATGNNSLIFPLPFKAIRTIANEQGDDDQDTFYTVKRLYSNINATNGVINLSSSSGEFDSYNATDWIVVTNPSPNTDGVVQAVAKSVADWSYGANNYQYTLTLTDTSYSGPVKVLAVITKTLTPKEKTLQVGAQTQITTAGRRNQLDKCDVIRIQSVIDNDGIDITDQFYLDSGQRDNYYDFGAIVLKNQYDPVNISNPIVVTFDYFSHGTTGDYFCVDSYPLAGADSIDYSEIPTFQSSKGLVELRDVIDFRPTMGENESFTPANGGRLVEMVKPNSLLRTDISYYLGRKDKVYVDKYGKFGIVKGVSSLNPKLPEDPKDSMVLYHLTVAPYTFGIEDVIPKMLDHRRYTMRDIGKLENRIKNLEYFTTLSMLEKDAADYQNPNGTIKKGFMVDSFYGHNVGYASHPDYSCSVDKRNGILRPQFTENYVRIAINETLSNTNATDGTANYRITGSLLTLDYTSIPYIEQPYSSYAEYVNPYAIFNWVGDMQLSPDTDNWKDTETRPEVIIDQVGIYDSFKDLLDATGVTGTIWNEWQVNWTGEPVVETKETSITNGNYVTTSSSIIESIRSSESRSGLRTDVVPDTVKTTIGDRIVEVNFIPFIRSRIVSFKATRMKPNTKVFAYFDGKDITSYTTQTDRFYQFTDFDSTQFYTNVYNFNGETQWPATLSEVVKTDLVTDDNGSITGFFLIPNNDAMKFKVGQRVFRLTDSADNIESDTTTAASAIYEASGLLESKENLVLSTRVPRVERSAVTEDSTVLTVNTSTITSTTKINSGWVDPLAQTIMVDEPGGIFATSLTLYFKTADPDIPVTVYLVPTDNGIPTSTVIPFSKVTQLVDPENDVSDDASVPKDFVFDSPVHLQQGVEYAIIIVSMSDIPQVWVSEVGELDVTEPSQKITKQPYAGSFFTSQNASTWTPYQDKDLKFVMKRAEFNIEEVSNLRFENLDLNYVKLEPQPITTTNGSNIIRVYHRRHGMFVGSTVDIYGVVENDGVGTSTMNGIPLSELNDQHSITYMEEDFYEFAVNASYPADTTGNGGGTAVYASSNVLMDLMHLQAQQLVFPDTSVTWSTKTTSGRSTAGNEALHLLSSSFYTIIPNENTQFTRPQLIPSHWEETNGPGLIFNANLRSSKSTLSPVIDLDRLSVIAIHNIINNPTDNSELYNSGNGGYNLVESFVDDLDPRDSSTNCNYITRKVQLADNADRIRVIMGANRPSGTSIELYYKTQTNDDIDFDSVPWILHQADEEITVTENPYFYYDVEYDIFPQDVFSSMAFKIVLKSSNNCYVPTIKDLRAIAFFTTV